MVLPTPSHAVRVGFVKDTELLLLAWVRQACTDGEALRIRVDSGLSQSEVGDSIGVTVPAISRWENGERAPRGDVALAYGRLLRRLQRAKAGAR